MSRTGLSVGGYNPDTPAPGGEVYITGNRYDDFRQVINMPQ